MKHIHHISLIIAAGLWLAPAATAQTEAGPKFRHVESFAVRTQNRHDTVRARFKRAKEAILHGDLKGDTLYVRTPAEIIEQTEIAPDIPTFNRLLAPWVFSEYRALDRARQINLPPALPLSASVWRKAGRIAEHHRKSQETAALDSVAERQKYLDQLWGTEKEEEEMQQPLLSDLEVLTDDAPLQPSILGAARPAWLENAYEAWNLQEDMMYSMMTAEPSLIEYAYWNLPVPPSLPDEDHSFHGYLKRNPISGFNLTDAVITDAEVHKTHWLHVVNAALQFSQAYVSENWYQGGNNHLSLYANFLWDVQLNPVWHPNTLFQSTVSYKLGMNSVTDDQYRKYSISQDIFQYNIKFGYKARKNWYYSITGQFKTQVLNNYKKNTMTRMASLLSPADLNLGLGMTYTKVNKSKTFQFNASIAPLSYNLRMSIDKEIDPTLFNIPEGKRTHSEIGSNAELTLNWKWSSIVSYKSRLFLFSDYKYFLGDWENTFNFQFSKLFSTQLFINPRYDSSAIYNPEFHWNKWMLKEILSIGLSYTFSTK